MCVCVCVCLCVCLCVSVCVCVFFLCFFLLKTQRIFIKKTIKTNITDLNYTVQTHFKSTFFLTFVCVFILFQIASSHL